jgi:polyferredoxin
MALKDEAAERAGGHPKNVWKHVFRPRTILYTALWSLVGVAMIVALFIRSPIDVNVTPERNPLFVTLSDGAIRNTYTLRLRNKHPDDRPFRFSITADATLKLELEGTDKLEVIVPADATLTQRLYITAPAGTSGATTERSDIRLWISDTVDNERVHADTVFNGKGQ